jgi:hypothetical protein
MLDIRALQRGGEFRQKEEGDQRKALAQMLRSICEYRQDWNGEVITLRESDLATISLLLNLERGAVLEWLTESKILLKKIS